ncbi:Centrosomal protein of 135 kDa [Fasciola hepatica]|uniref:Centrosomal protein of 135 kDa n=1 Tax=Fasciola hepatica TaxID=6192 RepID=A0A4E0RUD8_FASHE|nr:Centrosomal protein of 135 kDa [Fasciola hepatica]
MYFERELHTDLNKFTKVFKDRHGNVLTSFAKEEKKIAEDYQEQSEALTKKHRKQADRLQKQIATKKKDLHRKLEHEMQVELRLHRRYVTLRSQSTGRVNTTHESERGSVYSLDNTHVRNVDLTEPSHETTEPRSTSNLQPKTVVRPRSRWMLGKVKKHGDQLSSEMESTPELAKPFRRLKQEMDERLKYADEDSRMAIADLEWHFLKERHQLKRDYLEALADFKQRRLLSVGQLKKSRIKGYFDIRRKWLMAQHSKEMEARNRAQQESMKRLAMAQSIERQTACRLARTTAKGQRKVSLVLSSVTTNDSFWDRDYSKGSRSHVTALETRPISADTALIDMIFTKTGHSTPDNVSVNQANKPPIAQARPHTYYDGVRPTTSITDMDEEDIRATQSTRTLTTYDREREREATASSLSVSSSKRLGRSDTRARGHFKPVLRQAKSVSSIHSALDACDQMQRAVINTLSKQQVDQWTDVLNQERSLTEALMEAHTEQKKALLEEETGALRRAQIEQEYRSADLAVVLEATEKFAEREFAAERNRMIAYYYGSSEDVPPSSSVHLDPTETDLAQEFNMLRTNELTDVNSRSDIDKSPTNYTTVERQDKCIVVSPKVQAMMSNSTTSSREHVIICREERAQ